MLNNKKEFKMNYGGKEITIETGRLASKRTLPFLPQVKERKFLSLLHVLEKLMMDRISFLS